MLKVVCSITSEGNCLASKFHTLDISKDMHRLHRTLQLRISGTSYYQLRMPRSSLPSVEISWRRFRAANAAVQWFCGTVVWSALHIPRIQLHTAYTLPVGFYHSAPQQLAPAECKANKAIRQIQVRIRSWLHWMRMLGDSAVISTNRMRWWLDAKANTSGSSPEISWRSRLWNCCQFTNDALPLEPAFARRTPPSHLHAQHGGLIQWWHVGGDRALMATSYQASNWWDHFWERLNYILHIIT